MKHLGGSNDPLSTYVSIVLKMENYKFILKTLQKLNPEVIQYPHQTRISRNLTNYLDIIHSSKSS
jgi:hypothetical protein